MIKTQVQLPDELYHKAKAIAQEREWSLAEVVRRGIEYMALTHPLKVTTKDWKLPVLNKEDFRPEFDDLDFKKLMESDEIRKLKP
jgi:hypothetical protein